jgi:hypothetical protein
MTALFPARRLTGLERKALLERKGKLIFRMGGQREREH